MVFINKFMKLMPEFLPSFRLALKILSLIFSFLLLFSHRGYQNCFKRDDKFYKNFKVLWQLRKIEWPPDVQFFLFINFNISFVYSASFFTLFMYVCMYLFHFRWVCIFEFEFVIFWPGLLLNWYKYIQKILCKSN